MNIISIGQGLGFKPKQKESFSVDEANCISIVESLLSKQETIIYDNSPLESKYLILHNEDHNISVLYNEQKFLVRTSKLSIIHDLFISAKCCKAINKLIDDERKSRFNQMLEKINMNVQSNLNDIKRELEPAKTSNFANVELQDLG